MGKQEPSARIVPSYDDSDGMDALKVLSLGGINLDPWQADILCDWLGRNKASRWAASTCGGSVPRQNGKSLLVQGRAAAGMILFNEQVVYSAHLQKTATETFEELRDYFEHPKIKKYVKNIATAIGRESITLNNGARIKFLARTRNGGRGQHGDLLIFDEAQELDSGQQASFLPAISASLNPQTIYIGTPPDPDADGTVFRGIRKKALAGQTKTTSWFEFSVDKIGDVHDVERWMATNPALGRRILKSTIEGECEQMDADTFARERLGWWSPIITESVDYAIPKDLWMSCASKEPMPSGKIAYGVKFSPDGAQVCLAGAVLTPEGKARIELIDVRSTNQGTRWLAEWLNQRYSKASCVVIDGRNGVEVLIERITDVWKAKDSVKRPNAKEVINAVSLVLDGLSEGSLSWYEPQDNLKESATTSIRRNIGQGGGWGFGGENSTPIEACSLALFGVKNSKRDPNRKMLIG